MSSTTIVNFSRNRRQELQALVEAAIRQRIFPGMELLVAKGEEVLLHEVWGNIEAGPEAARLGRNTLFDIASMTKPIATAISMMVLIEKGTLALEDKVRDFIPEFEHLEKDGIALRHLLTHTSGLPDWADLFSNTESQQDALQKLLAIPLQYPTGTAIVYSDLGFLLLGEIIRRVSGQSLGEFFYQNVSHPLQMARTAFNPLLMGWDLPIAPTLYCTMRQQLLRGIVHDENCFRFGGEGGNAGLFSTAGDVHRFCRMILGEGELEGVRVLTARTVDMMTANHNPRKLAPRGMGWDMKGEGFGYMSCGELMAVGSIGHTGFTGTSFWIERKSGLTVILLTNRVNIARDKNQPDMMSFRPRLHNLVVSLVDG
ncbi:MAG: serine hydrolase [SAR324 cluster bacterium]|nr:serine hydrolase [SAR324 cluster bacterium]